MTRRGSRAALEEVEIISPGSIGNLGPGFDTLSVAVQLYLRVRIVKVLADSPDTLHFAFVDHALVGENRIEHAFRQAREREGAGLPGLRVEVRSHIPPCAGLGSSGAATVAGLKLYDALRGARPPAQWLSLACEIDGHPDNVAAALYGGMTASCQGDGGRVTACAWRWPREIRFIVAIPAIRLGTSEARRVLPPSVPRADAVFNLQRAALLLRALDSRRYEDLREALRDRWHQPFRQSLVPGLEEALTVEHPHLLGVCLSGAGPSVVALATRSIPEIAARLEAVYRRMGVACVVKVLSAHQPFAPHATACAAPRAGRGPRWRSETVR